MITISNPTKIPRIVITSSGPVSVGTNGSRDVKGLVDCAGNDALIRDKHIVIKTKPKPKNKADD